MDQKAGVEFINGVSGECRSYRRFEAPSASIFSIWATMIGQTRAAIASNLSGDKQRR
jgi:hypothetical protein